MLKPWRIIRRMVQNLDVTTQHVVHQSDLLDHKMEAIIEGIANQSDLIRRKLDALNRVMHELREIQKAQLAMQRQAAETIREFAAAAPNATKTDRGSEAV